jgi:hypothetical protein
MSWGLRENARWLLLITKRYPVSLLAVTPTGQTWQVFSAHSRLIDPSGDDVREAA